MKKKIEKLYEKLDWSDALIDLGIEDEMLVVNFITKSKFDKYFMCECLRKFYNSTCPLKQLLNEMYREAYVYSLDDSNIDDYDLDAEYACIDYNL